MDDGSNAFLIASFRNPLDQKLPKRLRVGVWASIVSAVPMIVAAYCFLARDNQG